MAYSRFWPNIDQGSNTHGPMNMSGFLDDDILCGTFTKQDGNVLAYKWRHSTGVLQTIDLSTVASNHLELPLGIAGDNHFAMSTAMDDEDHVFIVGNHHDGIALDDSTAAAPTTTHMVECTNVADFTNTASWRAVPTGTSGTDPTGSDPLATGGGSPNLCYTYHWFERDTAGILYHFMSQSEATGGSAGRDWLCFKRTGGAWSAWNAIDSGDGTFASCNIDSPTTGVDFDRVYICGVLIVPNGATNGTDDRMYVWGIWRDNDIEPDSQRDPFCLWANGPNFRTWKTMTGDTQSMPITKANRQSSSLITGTGSASTAPNTATSGSTTGIVSRYRGGIYVDANGNPGMVMCNGKISDTLLWERFSWNSITLVWDKETPYTDAGSSYAREFKIFGVRWSRLTSSNRITLRRASDAASVRIGEEINMSGGNTDVSPCPVWLRTYGRFAICAGYADTPKIFTFGDGAKLK